MGVDIILFIFSGAVFVIYAVICFICIIFTFSLETYQKVDGFLNINLGFLSPRILDPLAININFFEDWMVERNKIIGPILILLSFIDIRGCFHIINKL